MRLPNSTTVFVPWFHETGKIIGCVHPHQLVKNNQVRLSGDGIVQLCAHEFQSVKRKKAKAAPSPLPTM